MSLQPAKKTVLFSTALLMGLGCGSVMAGDPVPPTPPSSIPPVIEAAPKVEPKDDARGWMERMNRALITRNYEGTYFHLRQGKVETLKIVHRVEDKKVSERLVSLDGTGREIIRSEGQQTCFLPDQRRVLVQPIQRRDSGLLGAPIFGRNVELYYQLQKLPNEKVSGRTTRVIAVNPRDNYRFGYCVWLDEETALPLKTQLLDAEGGVIEQILFAELTVRERIPASAVQPRVRSEGFEWVRQPERPETQVAGVLPWRAGKLPPGFKLFDSSSVLMNGQQKPYTHLVYSDGLATVSVFVEAKRTDAEPMKGPSRMGSSYVFSTVVQGHQVTAVGEVPLQTVKLIAGSTRPDAPAVAAEQ